MRGGSLQPSRQTSRITQIAWGLASLLFLFTAENIWIDPWLRARLQWMPSLVPEQLSSAWFLAFAVCGVGLTLLVVCQILLMLDRGVHVRTKIGTGVALLAVLLLSVQWIRVTSGEAAIPGILESGKPHAVTLTWKASTSQVAGYNVYRRVASGGSYVQINSSLIRGLTYIDHTVESGVTYCYVVRAVDNRGDESPNSNEATAHIP